MLLQFKENKHIGRKKDCLKATGNKYELKPIKRPTSRTTVAGKVQKPVLWGQKGAVELERKERVYKN